MASNYTATIGGSLVNVLSGTLALKNQIGQRSTGSLGAWSALGTTWTRGTQVKVYDETGALVYSGYVGKDRVQKPGARQGTGFLEHNLTLMDNCYLADKRLVAYSNLNVTAGQVVRDLVSRYLAVEGVVTLPNSVATGITIPEIVKIYKPASEVLTWLATQSGYWWNIDLNKVLWFQPYGGVSAPFVLDGTQVESTRGLTVELGNDQYVNRQFVKGARGTIGTKAAPLHETFNGNNQTRSFTLSYPVSSILKPGGIKLNGVDVTANSLTKGSTGGQFYYATSDAVIAQDTSQPLLQASDTLDVFYIGEFPIIALAPNNNLIAAQQAREGGGTGYVEAVYTNTKIHSQAAATQIAGAILGHYGADMIVLTFDTRTKGLVEGQSLTVNLPDFSLNQSMLVNDVEITDSVDQFNIWYHVTAIGSPVEAYQWQTYWQNLMNQSADPADLSNIDDTSLAQLFQFTATLTWTGTATLTSYSCPICSSSTLCGPTVKVC